MNDKNFNYLNDQVKYSGFGNALQDQLKENIQKGAPEFTLYHQADFGKDQAQAALHFRKSTQTDNYFFNAYELTLKKEGQTEPIRQTFHMGYDNNITFKEGYNLMSGRAVHKQMAKVIDTGKPGSPRLEAKGDKYNAWLKMDFTDKDKQGNFKMKQFSEGYGFKLEETLTKHPIKELADPDDKIRLIESLQKGNRQAVTFLIDGKPEKRFIEANPQHWNINIYDANMQKVDLKKSKGQSQDETVQQDQQQKAGAGQGKKQSEKMPDKPVQAKKVGSAKKKGVSPN